jgi:replicative DNA helicase
MNLDRLPPHAPDAERGVIGCCLEDSACLTVAQQKLVGGSAAFYDLRHRMLFDALCEMEDRHQPIDLITVQSHLRDRGQLEEVGGLTYLAETLNTVTSVHNIDAYLAAVRDKATLRAILQRCSRVESEVYAEDGRSVTDLVAGFQADVADLTQDHVQSADVPISEPMLELAEILEERRRGQQAITGVPTPFWYLNNMTCGLQRGEYYVVAARPSTGKTALAVDMSLHAARCGIPVLFYSIEMTAREIALRLLASASRVNGLKLRNGFWKKAKEMDIEKASTEIVKLPIRIDDRKSINGQDILLGSRRGVRQHNIGLIVVDYIQKLGAARQRNSRHEELSEASSYLARTAKELNVPVVVAAQLNRDSDKDRGGKKPLLADIKDCGSIEQDADVVGLLWEPKIDEEDEAEMTWLGHHTPDDPKDDSDWVIRGPESGWRGEFRRINLSIAKNRNGPTGDCELVMQKASARFVDAHSPNRSKPKEVLL